MPATASRHGFTLVELLISISLGLVIVYTMFAGFRVASQTVTLCNRMSIENRLLTAGTLLALDEVDCWAGMDRPGWQPCRTTPSKLISGAGGGYDPGGGDSSQLAQPFTPFRDSWTAACNELPAAGNQYDPVWLPHDPKTWYRGDGSLWLRNGSAGGPFADQSAWGDYGLFSGVDGNVQHGGGSTTVGAFPGSLPAGTYTWFADQQKGLKAALGFYGWWDYLPANAIIDWYDRSGGRAVRPYEMANRYGGRGSDGGVTNIGQFCAGPDKVWASGSERALTRSSYLYEQVLGICAPRQGIDDVNGALRLNRWMGGMRSLGWEFQGAVNLLMSELSRPVQIAPAHPADWPTASFDVRRYRIFARTVTQCFVRTVDPLTGQMIEINFRVSGTSLRGARLQRNLDD
jgi:prepilin-type N-terminal cleavage/methylation domain-containing protein